MKKIWFFRILGIVLIMVLAGCTKTIIPAMAATGETEELEAAVTINYGISNPWDSLMPYNSVSGSNYARIIYDKIYDRLAYVHADGTLSPRGA